MQTAEAFWDGIAAGYAKKPIKDVGAYEQTLARSRAHLSKDDVVLEVGCGTGTTALRLAADVRELVASDLSTKMIEIAREKASAQGVGNVRFLRSGVLDDGFGHGAFDAVIAFNLLHLLDDVPRVLRRIHGMVKPGGLLVSKTTCLAGHGRLWRVLIPVMQRLGLAPYVNFLSVRALETYLTEAGFEIVETGDYPAKPPNRFVVARRT